MTISVVQMLGGSPYGGTLPVVLTTCDGITQAFGNADIHVAASHPHVLDSVVAADYEVVDFPLAWRGIKLRQDYSALRMLAAQLSHIGPAAVHTHTTKVGVLGRSMVAAMRRNRRRPLILHTVHGFGFRRGTRPSIREALIVSERVLSTQTDALFFVSRHHRELAEEIGIGRGTRVFEIRNGVDVLDVEQRASDVASGSRLADQMRVFREQGGVVVYAFGRLARQKGFDVLVSALRSVSCKRDVWLVVAGDGPERAKLETQADRSGVGRVTFTGHIDSPYGLGAAADLTVFPSRYEGLSIALLEALACQLPILASDIPENREAAGDGARYFTSESEASLAHELERCLADADVMIGRAAAGRMRVLDHFSRDRATQEYSAAYAELLGAR